MTRTRFLSHVCRIAAVAVFVLLASGAVAQNDGPVVLDAVIQPSAVANISAGVITGILETIHVERGDLVEEGQLLAMVDARIERANLELARTRAESTAALDAAADARDFYQEAYARAQRLFETQVLSVEARDAAQQEALLAMNRWRTEVEAQQLAQIELQRAEAALEMRRITSPFDGVVTDRAIQAGESVAEGPLLTIAQLDPLYVEVVAPARLYGAIRTGTTGMVVLEAPIGGRYEARVVIVDQVLDPASNTFGIRLELPNPNYELPAGLRGSVEFTIDS